jgi:proteic killer suppression protein
MIGTFKHKGLKRLFEDDDRSKVSADMAEKIRLILFALDEAETTDDMDQPTFRLHRLKGDLKGFWAIAVRANWRIIFRFENNEVQDVDLIDYH